MEEVKKEEKCCEGESCGKCCCPMMAHCMGKKKHCHLLKLLVVIVALMVVFCLGVQLGKLKEAARSCYSSRGGMMDWGYKSVKPMMYNFKITDDGVAPVKEVPQTETKQ